MAQLDVTEASMLDYRRHVYDISKCLTSEEAYALGYIFALPELDYKDKPTLAVLVALEMQGYFSSTKPEGLVIILKTLNRVDLAEMTRRYIKRTRHARQKRTDRVYEVDGSAKDAYFEVAFMQNLITTNQLQHLKSVVREPTAKNKVEQVETTVARELVLLQCAKSLDCIPSDNEYRGKKQRS